MRPEEVLQSMRLTFDVQAEEIDAFEKELRKLGLGVEASAALPSGLCLWFRKYGDRKSASWRLVLEWDDGARERLLCDWTLEEHRAQAIDAFQTLLDALVQSAERELARLQAATREARAFVEAFSRA